MKESSSLTLSNSRRQPKALFLIVSIQMWECFSFYGMRVLLVLYMINQMNFSDAEAFGVFALYTGLVEFGGILGGIAADRLLGLKKAITLGGWLIALGHLTLALGSDTQFFFPALALIVVGSSLFSTNLSALLGLYYEQDDSRREAGFTLFYAGINLGSLLASLLCGYIGDNFGWHYGFGLAAIGMLIGNLTLLFFGNILDANPKVRSYSPSKKNYLSVGICIALGIYFISQGMAHENMVLPYVPWVSLLAVGYVVYSLLKSGEAGLYSLTKLVLYILALSFFFAAEEQMGSSMMMFSDRYATKTLLNVPIPSSVLISINPAVIILFGALMNSLLTKVNRSSLGKNVNFPWRIVIPFCIASAAFGGLALSIRAAGYSQPIPVIMIMGSILFISFAELMIGPAVYSLCSENATSRNQGMIMGLVPIGFSLASGIGGYFSKMMALEGQNRSHSLEIYSTGFMTIAVILLGTAFAIAIGLIAASKLINKNYQDIKI